MPQPCDLVGQPAPAFALAASTGQTVALSDFKGKKTVVLYFYPRADTPGCTMQACGFRDARPEYDRAGIAVLGISPDTPEDVRKFARKFDVNFPLLADADHAVAQEYGTWQQKSMYGKKYFGVTRTTFVIGQDGRVRHVFEKVKPQGHERQVLDWLAQNVDHREASNK